MRKVMLLVAMLAMVLAAAVPAFAQNLAGGGRGDDLIRQSDNSLTQQCQNNVDINQGGTAVTGDQTNTVQTGDINQNCVNAVNSFNGNNLGGDVDVVNVEKDVVKVVGFTKFDGVEHTVFFDVTKNVFFIVVEQEIIIIEKDIVIFFEEKVVSPDVTVVSPDVVTPDVVTKTTTVLPETGGASLLALGGGALLVAGGLLARRIVR